MGLLRALNNQASKKDIRVFKMGLLMGLLPIFDILAGLVRERVGWLILFSSCSPGSGDSGPKGQVGATDGQFLGLVLLSFPPSQSTGLLPSYLSLCLLGTSAIGHFGLALTSYSSL